MQDNYTVRWPVKRLEELAASIQYGYTAKAKHARDGPRYLRITDIQDENVDWGQVPSCEIGKAELTKYRLYPGDLVFARTGATVGKSYLIRGVIPQSVFASYLIRVQLRDEVEPRYVAYFFRSSSYWRQISESQAGIGQPNVNGKKLAQIRIPVAPLDEQRQIVAEIEKQFSRLDEAVANLKRVKANLKRYKAAVLKAAVEGRLVPTEAELARHEGRGYETGAQLLQRILETRRGQWKAKGTYKEPIAPEMTDLPEVPEGWIWASAEQVCDPIASGSTPSPEAMFSQSGDVPFIKVYNLTFDGSLDFSVKPTFVARYTHENLLGRSRVIPGDVLTNIVGPPLGKVSIAPSNYPEWNINQAIVNFRTTHALSSQLLAYWLMSSPILRRLGRTAKATAGQSNLQVSTCRRMAIPVPPLAEQRRIVAEVDRHLSLVRGVEAEVDDNLKRAERLRSSVLSSAFAVSNDRT